MTPPLIIERLSGLKVLTQIIARDICCLAFLTIFKNCTLCDDAGIFFRPSPVREISIFASEVPVNMSCEGVGFLKRISSCKKL